MPPTHAATDELAIDPAAVTARIGEVLRRQVGRVLRRRGVVVGMSGGVDSSVCAALAVEALGADRVFGLMMPERESDGGSLERARRLADRLGIRHATEEISSVLDACGCYERRNAAIRRLVPAFGADWACKVTLPRDALDSDRINVFHLTLRSPAGELRTLRLPPVEYREIVAATSFKQRVRKMFEYHHADRLHFAVLGTPNRLEYDQGFFVKGGDGAADVKPIAHLYKTQVYSLAEFLGVPEEITARPPTTDTYSLEQTQEEFFFGLPTRALDRVLHGHNAGRSAEETARRLGEDAGRIRRVYAEIERKRSTTRYLHLPPLLTERVTEAGGFEHEELVG